MRIETISWNLAAWDDYLYWQEKDKRNLKRINQLIKDIYRNPFDELGKPEPLEGNPSGFWSRRIDDEHRLVYTVERAKVVIIACRGHYEN